MLPWLPVFGKYRHTLLLIPIIQNTLYSKSLYGWNNSINNYCCITLLFEFETYIQNKIFVSLKRNILVCSIYTSLRKQIKIHCCVRWWIIWVSVRIQSKIRKIECLTNLNVDIWNLPHFPVINICTLSPNRRLCKNISEIKWEKNCS